MLLNHKQCVIVREKNMSEPICQTKRQRRGALLVCDEKVHTGNVQSSGIRLFGRDLSPAVQSPFNVWTEQRQHSTVSALRHSPVFN